MKRNINTNRAPISSEEILKGKNFSELAKAYQAQTPNIPSKPFYKKGWFAGTVASVAIIATTLLVLNKNNTKEITENKNTTTLISDTTNNQFIAPPVLGIDVKKDRYFVNADAGGKIIHHTGSEITIPENSFVKEDGTPVNGEVEIQYREFHDQTDIFFSGIPMEYDSAGVKYNFESAGMMEILGFQNGEKLKLAPEKTLAIKMTSYNPSSKFNIYYLDEALKNWNYRGKDTIVNENDQDFTYNPSPIEEDELIDNDLFKEVKETKLAVTKQEQIVEVIQKDIKKIKNTKPTRPLKAKENVHSFDLDVNKAEFPEIATYSGTVFEVIDQVNFDTKIYDTQWEDIILTQKTGGLCIELTKGTQKKKIEVKPVLEGSNYTAAIKKFSEKFKDYSKKLGKRKEDEKIAEAELLVRKQAYDKQQQAYEKIRQAQVKAYEKQQLLSQAQRGMFGKTKVNRMYNINQMGRWNSDHPRPPTPPYGHRVLAKYFDANTSKELGIQRASLIEKRRNMTWNLNAAQRTVLTYNPKRTNYIWCVTNDNKIGLVKPESFKGNKNGEKCKFKMQVIDIEDKTIDDLKELIKA
jgi:hypothetical protein